MNPERFHFEYRVELHGWRKMWARLRRKSWATVYEGEVERDLSPYLDLTETTFTFKGVSPITKRDVP